MNIEILEAFMSVLTECYKIAEKGGFKKGLSAARSQQQHSPGWLRSEIHKRLNQLFPGEEFDRARYRWLRSHSLTTSHMSQMKTKELIMVNKELGQLLAESRNQNGSCPTN